MYGKVTTGMLLAGSLGLCGSLAADEGTPVLSFAKGEIPENLVRHHVTPRIVEHEGKPALGIDFEVTAWPNVFFKAPPGGWDWSAYAGLEARLYNPEDRAVQCSMRVDNEGADGTNHCNTSSTTIPAHSVGVLSCRFNAAADRKIFWGMRGVPIRGPLPSGPELDTSHIIAFQIYLPQPGEPHRLILLGVRLVGQGGSLKDMVPMPFVDRFGQYKHAGWPGKIHSKAELVEAGREEARTWKTKPDFPGRDRFGGWADGPRLKATGWFRTELVQGKWWLVTPTGHLFFSVGVDCVGTWQRTWISGRDGWFDWLPDQQDPLYASAFDENKGAHSMAEPIGGKGTTFGFYAANLVRKYGPEWELRWRESVYARLHHWGFNTIGNWSQSDVLAHSPIPFVVHGGIWGKIREIEGARGYWGRMRDVFDDSFANMVDKSMASVTKPYRDNPLCIGYFIDNELSWETVRKGTLASPPDQPCRIAFVDRLKKKYGTLKALNQAWESQAKTWDDLRVPPTPNKACTADLDDFEYAFAKTYFSTIHEALRRHAPHQLYLGCRFSSAPPIAVRACTDIADVVSFNRYEGRIAADKYSMRKPILIGEFHFGALDRGMFHTGLVAAENQEDRAAKYVEYVRAVLDAPAFVGCHWFQFVDEPITGRWFDGENYNIGFVTVTDTPYPELVREAKRVHRELYTRRYGKTPQP